MNRNGPAYMMHALVGSSRKRDGRPMMYHMDQRKSDSHVDVVALDDRVLLHRVGAVFGEVRGAGHDNGPSASIFTFVVLFIVPLYNRASDPPEDAQWFI